MEGNTEINNPSFLEGVNFENDKERLRYISKLIFEVRREARKEVEGWQFDTLLSKRLADLYKNLSSDSPLAPYAAEAGAFIEASRLACIEKQLIKYKEHLLMEDGPRYAAEEIKRQDIIREDLVEGRALLQYHILQNENDPKYLKEFISNIKALLINFGFSKKEYSAYLRGIMQELGVFRLLQKSFPHVKSATPEEDTRYGIDFFATTNTGKQLVIQSKSSSFFGRSGIFNEEQIRERVAEMQTKKESPYDQFASFDDEFTSEIYIPKSVRALRLQESMGGAKAYMAQKGAPNAEYYLIVARGSLFDKYTGEAKETETKKLTSEIKQLAG